MPPWVRDYVGLPFMSGGRGRDGLDCWGLVRLVLAERYGVEVPSYAGAYGGTTAADAPDLAGLVADAPALGVAVEPGTERPGDVVVMRHGAWPCHVGLVIGPGAMLHIEQGADACVESYTGMRWARKVVGLWRPWMLVDRPASC